MSKRSDLISEGNICDVVSAGGYNYYGYERRDGSWIIMRENTAETQYRYSVGKSAYATAWAAYASQAYGTPSAFGA